MAPSSDVTGFFSRLFDTTGFPARWTCGQWGALEGWTHIIADSVIAAAYIAIPASLFIFLRKRRDIEFPRIVWLFIAFILSCGIAHAFEAAIFWWPAYRLTGLLKAVTAVVSIITVVALIRALPVALSLPSLNRRHNQSAQRLTEVESQLREVEASRSDAERRAADLSLRERRLREALTAARTCAVQWDVESARIVSESGYRHMLLAAEIERHPETLSWEALIGRHGLQILFAASRECAENGGVLNLRFPIVGGGGTDLRVTATAEPPVAGQPRLMVGLLSVIPRSGDFGTSRVD